MHLFLNSFLLLLVRHLLLVASKTVPSSFSLLMHVPQEIACPIANGRATTPTLPLGGATTALPRAFASSPCALATTLCQTTGPVVQKTRLMATTVQRLETVQTILITPHAVWVHLLFASVVQRQRSPAPQPKNQLPGHRRELGGEEEPWSLSSRVSHQNEVSTWR